MGVFATRSPFRPNAIGLSCVKILSIEHTRDFGPVIHVAGADLMNGTPILDIKPYIPYADCHSDAIGGFTEHADDFILDVQIPPHLMDRICENKRAPLVGILSHDPRPSYQNDPERIYGMDFSDYNIRFQVNNNNTLTVLDIAKKL